MQTSRIFFYQKELNGSTSGALSNMWAIIKGDTKKVEAKQQLENYIGRVEELINDPGLSLRMKKGNKAKIEEALSDAMSQLELDDSSADDLKKKELALKRAMTKAMATR